MEDLRTFKNYKKMKDAHQKDINEFGFIFVFAFTEKEFIEKMVDAIKERKPKCTGITTIKGIAKYVVSIGAGGYVLREDIPKMNQMFKRHEEERKLFRKTEKALVEEILYEMNNHEYGYTRDPFDTLVALNKSKKDFDNEMFKKAWKKAEKKCFCIFDEIEKGDENNG